ncbi:ABC-type Fe3+-hydroxamate transport system, substrate-binding protein [Fodinibius roseus]|uniref:ABC-type Fe3+-hydroxamate transport system, substrate-binding protein n=1 Tax=Fodinibius roseus TaxID=1194090 RepID=A0A1M4ZNS9_9BACT|nr:helical backbone metal receptor [Fodinibius roseus]SHF19654.1 ABC-type Fe3+-hydroxamate transport system, substrate-binding protein [Fodinibius roseus]
MASNYRRIISLVPSLTELLIDLELKDKLAGRTRFCVHPKEEVADIPIVGGTKNPRLDTISQADPDLIIANKEENRPTDIKTLMDDFEVEVTDIATIEDALITIHRLGQKLQVTEQAGELISDIQDRLTDRPGEPELRTAYMIWKDPWMSIGGDTYIHDVLEHWNLPNIYGSRSRYPKLDLNELQSYNPDLVLLSSEPYPFREKHLAQVQEVCPAARVLLVEGEWFSWYGSHMKHAFGRLNVWRKAIS